MLVAYWFPTHGHPDGPSDVAWFRIVDGFGYKADGHPDGAREEPAFRVIEDCVLPTMSLPGSDQVTFQIVGSYAYAAHGSAWFRIEIQAEGTPPASPEVPRSE